MTSVLGTDKQCRFFPSVTSPMSADVRHPWLSHGDSDPVCLTERFISYDISISIGRWSLECRPTGAPHSLGLALVVVDEFAVPGFAAFVDGEGGDDESGDGVEPGGTGELEQANAEQGGNAQQHTDFGLD